MVGEHICDFWPRKDYRLENTLKKVDGYDYTGKKKSCYVKDTKLFEDRPHRVFVFRVCKEFIQKQKEDHRSNRKLGKICEKGISHEQETWMNNDYVTMAYFIITQGNAHADVQCNDRHPLSCQNKNTT